MRAIDYRRLPGAASEQGARRFNRARILPTFLTTLALAMVGGWLYVYALDRFRDQIQTVILAVIMAGACWALVKCSILYAEIRATGIAVSMALLIGTVILWAIWVCYLHRVYGAWLSYSDLLRHPLQMVQLIRETPYVTKLTLGGEEVVPSHRVVTWIVEGLLVVGGSMFGAMTMPVKRDELCAKCGGKLEWERGLPRFADAPVDQVREMIEARQFDQLAELELLANEDDPQIDVRLQQCRQCGDTNLLTVSRTAWNVNEVGVARVESLKIVSRFELSEAEAEAVLHLRTLSASAGND